MYIITGVTVGSYELGAVGETRSKCLNALVKTYHDNFGTFAENGFKGKADWLDYHGINEMSCMEIRPNAGWCN